MRVDKCRKREREGETSWLLRASPPSPLGSGSFVGPGHGGHPPVYGTQLGQYAVHPERPWLPVAPGGLAVADPATAALPGRRPRHEPYSAHYLLEHVVWVPAALLGGMGALPYGRFRPGDRAQRTRHWYPLALRKSSLWNLKRLSAGTIGCAPRARPGYRTLRATRDHGSPRRP